MLGKVKNTINLISNMGWRYVRFRGKHELLRRSGLLKAKFPVNPVPKLLPDLNDWRQNKGTFFFEGKQQLSIPHEKNEALKKRMGDLRKNKLLFFNSTLIDLGDNYNWITNPDNNFQYDCNKHWTEIPDYSKEAGDIKYVWEKSRFSFLYDIIRYDYHFEEDNAALVFNEIISWIKANPVNQGPNWRCSQEISLRVLNWIFALYFYQESEYLTADVFNDIMQSIYWQVHHVFHNIDFSRIAVRNNHAITETMTLYVSGLLFPNVKEFQSWSIKGKQWFEEEIAYQIYEDGTFLQFSMNYHRVVIQLLTWAIKLSELNNSKLPPVVYDRAAKSLEFLRVCMDDASGALPNYGANDGALFFKLNNATYRDYRPQLDALAGVLKADASLQLSEDSYWYGVTDVVRIKKIALSAHCYSFAIGGYYVMREEQTLTFIRCGNHKDRPSQADNLHLDIWYKGENILMDSGSYKYNTDNATLSYFMGTTGHNTVMIDQYDQMQKGGRFIWYHWSQCKTASLREDETTIYFSGTISAFRQISPNITHTRTIIKQKGIPHWIVKDEIGHLPAGKSIKQLWHLPKEKQSVLKIEAGDQKGTLNAISNKGMYSSLYGQKEENIQLAFTTETNAIDTIINISN